MARSRVCRLKEPGKNICFANMFVDTHLKMCVKASWLSWLERRPVTAEVEGSSPSGVAKWDLSSAGRASALQAEGHRFEPCRSHFFYADVAQLAEQLICNQQVNGSSPLIGLSDNLIWVVSRVAKGDRL